MVVRIKAVFHRAPDIEATGYPQESKPADFRKAFPSMQGHVFFEACLPVFVAASKVGQLNNPMDGMTLRFPWGYVTVDFPTA